MALFLAETIQRIVRVGGIPCIRLDEMLERRHLGLGERIGRLARDPAGFLFLVRVGGGGLRGVRRGEWVGRGDARGRVGRGVGAGRGGNVKVSGSGSGCVGAGFSLCGRRGNSQWCSPRVCEDVLLIIFSSIDGDAIPDDNPPFCTNWAISCPTDPPDGMRAT